MILDAKCKRCRRANRKLFLKGERCLSQKCAMVRRAYIPGMHGKKKGRRLSEYGQQLAEKQKMRLTYGVTEKQFKGYFKKIVEQPGNKEELLVQQLERRLDNVVFRLGWAQSRGTARQIVGHGHILVNGRKVDIPSYQAKKGDKVNIKKRSQTSPLFEHLQNKKMLAVVPGWLTLDKDKVGGQIVGEPQLEDFGQAAEISKVIEFYSR